MVLVPKEEQIFSLEIKHIQPSQLFINTAKLDSVLKNYTRQQLKDEVVFRSFLWEETRFSLTAIPGPMPPCCTVSPIYGFTGTLMIWIMKCIRNVWTGACRKDHLDRRSAKPYHYLTGL